MQSNFCGYTAGNAAVPLRRVFAVHVETDDAGKFAAAHALPENGPARSYDTPASLMADFLTRSYEGWELLLYQADYDMRYMLPALEALALGGVEIVFTLDKRGRIIFAKICKGKHRWYIRDCSAMLPADLATLRNLAGVSDGVPVERVLQLAYKEIVSTLRDTFGVRPSVTIGTTGVHAWLSTLPEHHIFYRQREGVEAMGRAGYFGGLVWLTTQAQQENCTYIDCNAMYAHAMRQGVPVMSPTRTKTYYPDRPGIYSCSVWCPGDIPFAFVPERNEMTYGVNYPRGKWFDTVLCSTTIELAREKGYTVDVIEGYVFEQLDYPFDEFVNKCQELENKYRGTGAASVIKGLRNSLYGKFGQRNEGTESCFTTDTDRMIAEGWHQVLMSDDGEIIDNLWQREIWIERSYMQPVWAAWITANARNMLTRAIYALGPKDCVYGDTDSIIVPSIRLGLRRDVIRIGTQYGEWKVKEQFLTFRAMGRKMYGGLTDQGEYIIVAAGIQKGVLTEADMALLRPHGPPVATRQHTQQHRALQTVGGRPISGDVVKYIEVPELDAAWQHW